MCAVLYESRSKKADVLLFALPSLYSPARNRGPSFLSDFQNAIAHSIPSISLNTASPEAHDEVVPLAAAVAFSPPTEDLEPLLHCLPGH